MGHHQHIIHRRTLEVEMQDRARAERWLDTDGPALADRLAAVEEGVFDRLCADGRTIAIDRLELDLGIIDETWSDEQLQAHYRALLTAELDRQAPETPASDTPVGTAAYLPPVLYFLQTGHLPWWGAPPASPHGETGGGALADRLIALCETDPGTVRAWFRAISGPPPAAVLMRARYQFGPPALLALLRTLAPELAAIAAWIVELPARALRPAGQAAEMPVAPVYTTLVDAFIAVVGADVGVPAPLFWPRLIQVLLGRAGAGRAALAFLAVQASDPASTGGSDPAIRWQELTAALAAAGIDGALRRPKPRSPRSFKPKVAATPSGDYSAADGAARTRPAASGAPHGTENAAAPAAAGLGRRRVTPAPAAAAPTDNRKAGQPMTDAAADYPVRAGKTLAHRSGETATRHDGPAHPTAPAAALKTPPPGGAAGFADAAPQPAVAADIAVSNAGAVLLWPFFGPYFTRLGLMGDKGWRDEAAQLRAVHHLEYVLTEADETPEYELPLVKLLCGLPLEAPVPARLALDPWQQALAEDMVRQALAAWPAMRGTSVAGFRASFLVRDGLLSRQATGWLLRVQPAPFDMLLAQLPWPYRRVALSWMEKPLEVEW